LSTKHDYAHISVHKLRKYTSFLSTMHNNTSVCHTANRTNRSSRSHCISSENNLLPYHYNGNHYTKVQVFHHAVIITVPKYNSTSAHKAPQRIISNNLKNIPKSFIYNVCILVTHVRIKSFVHMIQIVVHQTVSDDVYYPSVCIRPSLMSC